MTTTRQPGAGSTQKGSGAYATAPRTVAIAARTAHTLATSIYLGGKMLNASDQSLRPWRRIVTVTGSVLLVTEVTHSRNWAHQGRGIATMAHVGVLAAGHLDSKLAKGAAVAALVIGSVGSHLPRSIRKWSVLSRSVLP
jgi:hypothetical protein